MFIIWIDSFSTMPFETTIFVCLVALSNLEGAKSTDMCRRVHEGKLRMQVLTGHVISTQTTHGLEECADLCDKDPPCYSVNYYGKQRKCELNEKTSFHHPEHMIRYADGSYLDIHRPYSDCSDYFCDVLQVCKMDRADRTYCRGEYILVARHRRIFQLPVARNRRWVPAQHSPASDQESTTRDDNDQSRTTTTASRWWFCWWWPRRRWW